MSSSWIVIALLLVGVSCPISCTALVSYKNTIIVDPEHGVNNASCQRSLPSARAGSDSQQFGPSSQIPCRNLSYALQFRLDSTQYVLASASTHTLGLDIELENINDVAFLASNGTALIQCLPGAGLSFVNCNGVVLNNLTFTGCGALRNSTSRNYSQADSGMQTFLVTLYFYQCQNISMDCVEVSNSVSATGVVMYDTYGTNVITGSTFTNNSVNGQRSGGGGFNIEFSYCIPGDSNCGNESHQVIGTSNSYYQFFNCTFSENMANTVSQSSSGYIVPYHQNHESFGRGGGLSIYFKGNATGNNISVSECYFIHNHALWGGGLLVEFDDESIANWVSIVSSHFIRNHCYFEKELGTGGGARIASLEQHSIHQSETRGNLVHFTGCTFRSNHAQNGGALSLSPLLQPMLNSDQVTTVHVYECSFIKNIAHLGAAANIATLPLVIHGEIMKVHFTHCFFTANNAEYSRVLENSSLHSIGVGAVYVNGVPVSFDGYNEFACNNGSALAAVGAYIDFSDCSALFNDNYGLNGAAIALLGNSFLAVNNYTSLNFTFNHARNLGGAIYNNYVGLEDWKVYVNCFVKYTDPNKAPKYWNSRFYFYQNHALLGDSIYSTSVQPCSWNAESGITNSSDFFCWSKMWDYGDGNCRDEIYTEPQDFFFNENKSIPVFPGIVFNLPIDAVDDLDHSLNNTFYTARVANPNVSGEVKQQYAVVSHDLLAVTGSVDGSLFLSLTTIGSRLWDIVLELTIEECPPGLTLKGNGEKATCVCASNFRGNLNCHFDSSIKHYSAILTKGHWMGKTSTDNNSRLLVGECPESYCYPKNLTLPNSTNLLEEYICRNQSRKGILCGECIEEYGPAVNSWDFECVRCNVTDTTKHIFYYILIAYVPTFFIFVAIILLNIRLTTGPAVSFILYAQMISSVFNARNYGFENVSGTQKMQNAYHSVYSIFNLDFFCHLGFPFCLSPHMNALDILQLQYLQACFPLLMIVLVVMYVKLKDCFWGRCKRLFIRRQGNDRQVQPNRQRLGTSLVHAFAAFLLLSYTKFGIPSALILHTVNLYYEDGSPAPVQRVYLAGNYSANDKSYYLGYSLLSYVVLIVFVLIPPFLLLDKPVRLFNHYIAARVRCIKYVWPVDKVNIVLDVFHGCYKPHMGFFAGLYFLFRLALFLTNGLSGGFLQYSLQQIFCCAIIAMLALFQPYQNRLYNIVDTLIFFDMAIINSLSHYAASEATINPKFSHLSVVFIVRSVLIWLPLVYMLSYLVWYFITTYGAQVKLLLVNGFGWNNDYQPLQRPIEPASSYNPIIDSDSVLLQRAQEPNTYRPTVHNYRAESDGEESGSSKTAQSTHGATPSTGQNSQSQMEVHDQILSSVIED